MEGGIDADWRALAKAVGWEAAEDPTETLASSATFLQHLIDHMGKYHELQRTQSDALLRTAQLEQQSKSFEEQAAFKEARIASLQAELDAVKGLYESAGCELKQVKGERGQLLATLEEARHHDERLKSRLSAVENEKTGLLRTCDRRLAEKATLEADHERLLTLMIRLRQDGTEAGEKLVEAQRSSSKLQFELQRLQNEVGHLKEKNRWSETELSRILQEVAEFRKQKSIELSELRSVLSNKTSELEVFNAKHCSLQSAYEENRQHLESALEQVRDLKIEITRSKADFEAEMGSTVRLVDLYKASVDEANQRISELEITLQASAAQVDEFEAAAEREKKTGDRKKCVADVFAENSQSRVELSRLRQENEKLKECLEEVCSEIESRAPLLSQERKENERLKRELLAMTNQVVELGRARDELLSKQSFTHSEIERLRRENHGLLKQSQDLSSQVQALILSVEPSSNEQSASAFADAIDEDSGVFKSVSELQAKNAGLLRRVHELEYATQHHESIDSKKLDAAMKEIEELNQARARQSTMLESLLRQQQSGLSGRASTISDAVSGRQEVDHLKAEKSRIERELRDQIQSMLKEEGELRVLLGKAESQAQYTAESLELLKKTLEGERDELNQLRNRTRELTDISMTLNAQLQAATADKMAALEREHRANVMASRHQAELETVKAVEERASKDLLELRSERERLLRLVSQLQSTITDYEGNHREMRERSTRQVELLEKELSSARQRLNAETESTRYGYLQADKERRELLDKQEQLLDELARLRAELIRLQAEHGFPQGHSQDSSSVEHYKAVAKTSEQALAELSKAFEEYREQVESSGSAQFERLYRELEAARAELSSLQQQYDTEKNEWQDRLAALEQLEQQSREHGNMRLEDVVRLQEIWESTKAELSAEREQSIALQSEITKLSGSIQDRLRTEGELKGRIIGLESQSSSFEMERTTLQQQYINLQGRFDELSEQYDSLLERLEGSLKPSYLFSPSTFADPEEDGQVQQVIKYLRRERDGLGREKSVLEEENRRLTQLYDQISSSYSQLKKSLVSPADLAEPSGKFSGELQELRNKIEQLSGVRQSAAALQAQVDALNGKLRDTEAELENARDQLQPLKEANRELRTTVAAQEREVKLVGEDRNLWKRRWEKAFGGHAIDEEEYKAELEKALQEKAQITEEANQKLGNLEARYNKLVERFNFYKKRCEELQSKLATAESIPQPPAPSDQLSVIAGELEETRGLLSEALQQKDELVNQLQNSEQKVSRLSGLLQKYKGLRREYDGLRSEYDRSMTSARDSLRVLEERFNDMQKEHSLHHTALTSQHRVRLDKLQKTLEEYKQRFGEVHVVPKVNQVPEKRPTEGDEDDNDNGEEEEDNEKRIRVESEEEDEEDIEDEYEEPSLSDDAVEMTDDNIMPVIAAPIATTSKPVESKVDLLAKIKALSPVEPQQDRPARPRFSAPLTPNNSNKEHPSGKKQRGKTRGQRGRRRNQ